MELDFANKIISIQTDRRRINHSGYQIFSLPSMDSTERVSHREIVLSPLNRVAPSAFKSIYILLDKDARNEQQKN